MLLSCCRQDMNLIEQFQTNSKLGSQAFFFVARKLALARASFCASAANGTAGLEAGWLRRRVGGGCWVGGTRQFGIACLK